MDQKDRLLQFHEQLSEHPLYLALRDYLMQRRSLPPVKMEALGPATAGEFARGKDLPSTGQISLNYGAEAGTLAHELTHATDQAITRQFYEGVQDRRLNVPQFEDAYRKLRFRGGPQELAKRLAPAFLEQNKDYRATNSELPAFGVGDTLAPGWYSLKAPAHLNPTMATETAILLELAQRAQSKRNSSQGR